MSLQASQVTPGVPEGAQPGSGLGDRWAHHGLLVPPPVGSSQAPASSGCASFGHASSGHASSGHASSGAGSLRTMQISVATR